MCVYVNKYLLAHSLSLFRIYSCVVCTVFTRVQNMKQFGELPLVLILVSLLFLVNGNPLRQRRQLLATPTPTRPPLTAKQADDMLCFKCDCSRRGVVKCTGIIGDGLRAILRVARINYDTLYFKRVEGKIN